MSNSFAAYRREALLAAGGFPEGTILSEDMMAGARLLQQGWKLAYCADACVQHSHNYTLAAEFKRYFDIGVFHHREQWLLAWLGKAEGGRQTLCAFGDTLFMASCALALARGSHTHTA
ncbi:hypothetical protein HAALTHF_27910n [Vreelandella aquamarina]|nr:hypothetical protein HAALTHF_27910n [Halomonas axialensis]